MIWRRNSKGRGGWLPAAALAVGLLCGPALAADAPAGEPSNILNPNQDAVFDAVKGQREALLQALTPVTEADLWKPADGDWLTWRRSGASLGHSPLKEINRANVSRLAAAWSYALPPSGNEIAPLVHDGVLFIESGASILALDGATGDLLWQYVRPMPSSVVAARNIVKNLAIFQDKLFAPTADGHVVALEVKTGKLVWDHEVLGEAEKNAHLSLDGGPIVARGKVVMGTSGCNIYPGGCFIFALDARTGQEAWRLRTLDQSPSGADSWNGAPVEQRFGGSIWTSGSYDPELNLLYFGVGNTYDTGILLTAHAQKGRSDDGLYTASTVALDPDTGKVAWHFQHVRREVWDLDWAFEQSLVTVPVNGELRKLVVTGGKIALFDGVDRSTGQYAFSRDAGLQTLITAIDPKTGAKTINPTLLPEAGVVKSLCPHSGGGRNWPATSIDPNTRILYLQLYETCQDFTWKARNAAEIAAGGSDMQWVLHPRPGSDGKFGRVQAIDLTTGRTLWTQRRRSAFASSTLVTDGGLLFVGARDRYFYAYGAASGKALWRTRLAASPSSTPITYSAKGGQYVAVVAGGGGPVAWLTLTPEVENPAGGTGLTVFRLPEPGAVPAQ